MIIRELVTKLGFEFDPRPIDSADQKTSALKDKLQQLAALFASGAVLKGIFGLVHGAVELGSRLNDTAEQFGISTEALQRFQYVAGLSGIRAEQFNAAMGPLSRTIFAAGEGTKEATALFHKFGIQFKDNKGQLLATEDVIGNIAEAIKKAKSPAEQAGLAMKFFGRAGARLVPILKQGRAGLRQAGLGLERLGGPISKETIEALDDLGDRTDEASTAFNNLKVSLVTGLVPALTSMVTWVGSAIGTIRKWVESSHIAQAAFIALGTVIAFFGLRAFVSMLPVLVPLGLIALGVAALTLAYEDLWVTLKGGDSLLGRFVKWCDDSTVKAQGLLGVIKEIGHAVFGLGEKVYDALHPFEAKEGDQNVVGGAQVLDQQGRINGQKLEKRTRKRDPFGLLGEQTYYVPATVDPDSGVPNSINNGRGEGFGGSPLLTSKEDAARMLPFAPLRDSLDRDPNTTNNAVTNTTNNSVQIDVHASPGMNEEQLAVYTKQQFDTHMGKVVKNARAAALPSVPKGSQ